VSSIPGQIAIKWLLCTSIDGCLQKVNNWLLDSLIGELQKRQFSGTTGCAEWLPKRHVASSTSHERAGGSAVTLNCPTLGGPCLRLFILSTAASVAAPIGTKMHKTDVQRCTSSICCYRTSYSPPLLNIWHLLRLTFLLFVHVGAQLSQELVIALLGYSLTPDKVFFLNRSMLSRGRWKCEKWKCETWKYETWIYGKMNMRVRRMLKVMLTLWN